jgi:3-methyladenine DNA glycosylase AlkD
MDLSNVIWNQDTAAQFLRHLKSLGNPDKKAWSAKILNTRLDVLVVGTKVMQKIARDIFNGNYRDFLALGIFENYETIAIYGLIISKIKDFKEYKKYLDIYSNVMENWAHCDLLQFNINSDNVSDFLNLSAGYLKSEKVFVRRLGLSILFTLIKDEKYLGYAFNALINLKSEKEYYVNMMAAWLLSECIIRHKQQTLNFLDNNILSREIANKGVQKCRDSRRLSQKEKDMLLKYKIK